MQPEKIANALAAEIRAEAAAQRLSLPDLAERANVSRPSVYRYLSGERDIPVSALLALSMALRIGVADLFDRAHERARRDAESIGDAD